MANQQGSIRSWLFAGSLLAIPISPLDILPELEAAMHPPQDEIVVLEPAPNHGVVFHEVEPGESLLLIASRYRSDIGAIKKLSGLKRDLLQPGQLLKVPIEAQREDEPRLPPGVLVYTVRTGDSLERIAKTYGLRIIDLVSANLDLASLDRLSVGTRLYVPTRERGLLVSIQEGETLEDIARRYRVDLARLARANGLDNPLAIKPGDRVLVPGVAAQEAMARLEQRRKEERRLAEERRRRLAAERAARLRQVAYRGGTSAKGFQWPLGHFKITAAYHDSRYYRRFRRVHTGIDLAAPQGTPIYAAKGGVVVEAGWSRVGYGYYVKVDHGGGVETLYAHMSRIAVKRGQRVKQGALLGYVGRTGFATGPHLHFEVRIHGGTRNPWSYLPH
ncbi:MAG TPA: LysM peptidoglycan-binding domain-containing protein [Oceanithermus profundus]|uniref:LysM peptidoglycan-binding domain-containing protein n=1 Tax=Oceanithermus profundus TaxID=187137 RepID=A0A7C4VEU7_9DEIN|nr:LysM peptidoglycan-binding domain-containing protein [Oceanithermus profundus]